MPEWIAEGLEELRVRNVSAVYYNCHSDWRMSPRRIGDDMLFYVVKGFGRTVVNGRTHALHPGFCASFQRGVLHEAWHDADRPLAVISVHYSATIFESLTVPEVLGFPPVFDFTSDRALAGMFKQLCQEYEWDTPGASAAHAALVLRILLRILWFHSGALEWSETGGRAGDLRRLSPALRKLRQDTSGFPSIAGLARIAGLSESHFRRLFRKALGESPSRHIQRLRIEYACHLLRTTDLTIEAVSERVGYAEPACFGHTFKKHLGRSPGAFRRNEQR